MKRIPCRLLSLLLPALILSTGCERAPSYDIMGSFFPGWLICLAVGILLTAVSRSILSRYVEISWPVVVYPCLTAVFVFVLWLTLFH